MLSSSRAPDTAPVVNISAKHAGDEWLFTVQDNGSGIDKEFSDKIARDIPKAS